MTNTMKPLTAAFAATLFFSFFGLLFLIFTKYTLLSLETGLRLPFFPSFIVALIMGGLAGQLFSKPLSKKTAWYNSLFIGIAMALFAVLFISLGVLVHAWFYDATFLNHLHQWQDYFVVYGLVLLSVTLSVGIWLMALTGLVAIYFNKRFLPGLLAVDKLRHSQKPTADE